MKQYIVSLTSHLIAKNRYDEVCLLIENRQTFLDHVKFDLESGDVADMSPEKLGEIMCSFETGDVSASKEELFKLMFFTGDCGDMLRQLVSLCLAFAIRDRLSDERPTGIPKWERHVRSFDEGLRKVREHLASH